MWQRNVGGMAHCIMECLKVLGALSDAPDDALLTSALAAGPSGIDVIHHMCHLGLFQGRRTGTPRSECAVGDERHMIFECPALQCMLEDDWNSTSAAEVRRALCQ